MKQMSSVLLLAKQLKLEIITQMLFSSQEQLIGAYSQMQYDHIRAFTIFLLNKYELNSNYQIIWMPCWCVTL